MNYAITAIAISALLVPGITNAGLILTSDKANFLASAGTTTMESFESIAATPGAILLNSIPASDLSNHFDVTGASSSFQIWNTTYATHGSQSLFWLARNTTLPPDSTEKSFTLNNFGGFSGQINALGLYMTDWASAGAEGTLTFSNDNGESQIVAVSPPSLPDWNSFFIGVISDTPFTSATFTTTTDDGWHLIDEVYFAATVPEPSILFLIGAGGIGLLGLRIHREQS
jgi:PEP-CTERM motif